MSESIFGDKSKMPEDLHLSSALNDSIEYWISIKKYIKETHGEFVEVWKHYGKKSGWILKLLLKKRNIFFFTPREGYFRIVFVFGDKAVREIENSELPQNIKDTISTAKKYVEGRGLSLDVRSTTEAEYIRRLIDIKLRN